MTNKQESMVMGFVVFAIVMMGVGAVWLNAAKLKPLVDPECVPVAPTRLQVHHEGLNNSCPCS